MKITDLVIVNDSQSAWVARKNELIAALDSLGWEPTNALGGIAHIAPESTEDDDAYLALCNEVSAVEAEPDFDSMTQFAYAPAEAPNFRVWTWN